MSNALELVVDGKSFRDFTSVRVTNSIETAAESFEIQTADRDGLPFHPGAEVSLYMDAQRADEQRILRGFIDEILPELGPKGRKMRVRGRGATADAVDCSAMNDPGEWTNVPLRQLVAEIGEAVGVKVFRRSEDPFPEPFAKFKLQPGETAFEAIDRAAKMRGRLVYPRQSMGALEVALPSTRRINRTAGNPGVSIVEGENVKEARLAYNWTDRYSRYVVRGQAVGTDERFGDDVAMIEGEATDPEISRYRPLLVIADQPLSVQEAIDLAKWEAAVRAARGLRLSVTLQGWKCLPEDRLGSEFWRPNFLVSVSLPTQRIDSDFMIGDVTLSRTEREGTITTLGLMRPDAFRILETKAEEAVLEDENPAASWLPGGAGFPAAGLPFAP